MAWFLSFHSCRKKREYCSSCPSAKGKTYTTFSERSEITARNAIFSSPPGALGPLLFSCHEEKIHHRDHREKYFCSRQQRLQGYGSLFVDPQSEPASLLRGLCGLCGEALKGWRPRRGLFWLRLPGRAVDFGYCRRRLVSLMMTPAAR